MPILSLPIVSNSFPSQFLYLPRAAERRGKQTLQALVEVDPPKEVYVHEVVPEKEAPACNKFCPLSHIRNLKGIVRVGCRIFYVYKAILEKDAPTFRKLD